MLSEISKAQRMSPRNGGVTSNSPTKKGRNMTMQEARDILLQEFGDEASI